VQQSVYAKYVSDKNTSRANRQITHNASIRYRIRLDHSVLSLN